MTRGKRKPDNVLRSISAFPLNKAKRAQKNGPRITRVVIEKWRWPILPVSVPTSTFGARKLNFCVRNGNRWVLSAIITAMAIYKALRLHTYKLSAFLLPCLAFRNLSRSPSFFPRSSEKRFPFFQSPFPKTYNYIANSANRLPSLFKLVKIIEFS